MKIENEFGCVVLLNINLLQYSWRRGAKDPRGQGFKCMFIMVLVGDLSIFNFCLLVAIWNYFSLYTAVFLYLHQTFNYLKLCNISLDPLNPRILES
jgi:hypothetical protein